MTLTLLAETAWRVVVTWNATPQFAVDATGHSVVSMPPVLCRCRVGPRAGGTYYTSFTWAPYRAFDFETEDTTEVELMFYLPNGYTGPVPSVLAVVARRASDDLTLTGWTAGGYQYDEGPVWR